jgi:hypothetical protein
MENIHADHDRSDRSSVEHDYTARQNTCGKESTAEYALKSHCVPMTLPFHPPDNSTVLYTDLHHIQNPCSEEIGKTPRDQPDQQEHAAKRELSHHQFQVPVERRKPASSWLPGPAEWFVRQESEYELGGDGCVYDDGYHLEDDTTCSRVSMATPISS